jgi:hypothetical protein
MPPALLDHIVLNTSSAADSNPTRHPPPILPPPARNASFEPSIHGPSRGSLMGMRKRRTSKGLRKGLMHSRGGREGFQDDQDGEVEDDD